MLLEDTDRSVEPGATVFRILGFHDKITFTCSFLLVILSIWGVMSSKEERGQAVYHVISWAALDGFFVTKSRKNENGKNSKAGSRLQVSGRKREERSGGKGMRRKVQGAWGREGGRKRVFSPSFPG